MYDFLVDEVDFYLFCLFLIGVESCFVYLDYFDWGDLSELFVAVEVLTGYVVAVELLQTHWLEFHGAQVAKAEAVVES